MKKNCVKIAGLMLAVAMFTSTTAFAREIGEFSNFRVTSSYTQTGYLTKEVSNRNYVINLEPSRNLSNIKIKNRIVNSNGEARSDEYRSTGGYRYSYSNWASGGYIYALQMSRENWYDGAVAVTGSWSPDDEK